MYEFNEETVFTTIEAHWRDFMDKTHSEKCVIGISGGIDSTCTAALACKLFGKENVIGVSMPCNGQRDMSDVDKVFEHLGIKRLDFDIGDAFYEILDGVANNAIEISQVTRTNLPARLRMTALYAFAQSIPNSIVINTCNLSESLMGYDTLFGDDCGSFAPLKNLTKSEVRKLASWLGVPEDLVMKLPIDGLQDRCDEENFGFSYAVLDRYIRTSYDDNAPVRDIMKRYEANKFKLEIVNVKGPEFDFPDYVQGKNI